MEPGTHVSESFERLVGLFKALSDPTRLRMVGLMVERRRCGQELASHLSVSAPTISHHLRVLRQADLVIEERERPYTFYRLDLAALRKGMESVADGRRVQEFAAATGLPESKRKVLRSFFEGSRLLQIPAQRKKKEIVFEEILRRIPRRKTYSEREISRFIEAIHPDYATIRREFIMGNYMERAAGIYWLTERGQAAVNEGKSGEAAPGASPAGP